MTRCWGLGAQATGYYAYERVRCAGCRRWASSPLWYGPPGYQLAYCLRCAQARHADCPCLLAANAGLADS